MRSFPYSYFISRSVECIKRTQKETQTHTCIHGYGHSWGGGKDSTVSGSLAGYWPINLDNIIGRCKTPIKLMCRLPWSQPIVLMSLIRALRKKTIRYGEKFSKLPLHIPTIQGRVFLRKQCRLWVNIFVFNLFTNEVYCCIVWACHSLAVYNDLLNIDFPFLLAFNLIFGRTMPIYNNIIQCCVITTDRVGAR